MRLRPEAAREQVAALSAADLGKPIPDRGSGLLGNFKLHRPTGLFLNDDGAISDSAASADIVDLQLHEITTSKFAVDRQVEHGEVAGSVLQLKPDPDGPDIPASAVVSDL